MNDDFLAIIARKGWPNSVRELAAFKIRGYDTLIEIINRELPLYRTEGYFTAHNRAACFALKSIMDNPDLPLDKKTEAFKIVKEHMSVDESFAEDIAKNIIPISFHGLFGL